MVDRVGFEVKRSGASAMGLLYTPVIYYIGFNRRSLRPAGPPGACGASTQHPMRAPPRLYLLTCYIVEPQGLTHVLAETGLAE
jgi:hypothetical protein